MAPFDLVHEKGVWLAALADAETFVRERPVEECGALYYSARLKVFVMPRSDVSLVAQNIVLHFGAPGGVLPRIADARIQGDDAR